MVELTPGVCSLLADASTGNIDSPPQGFTVQFLSIKKVPNLTTPAANDRFRIVISDGVHYIQSMLATQLNHLVYDNVIGRNTIALISNLTCNVVQDKRLVIILGIEVVSKDEEKIGNPVQVPQLISKNSTQQTASPSSDNASPVAQSSQQPSRQPTAAKGGRTNVYPIEGLSPYQNNWTIKALVTQKSEIRKWSNQKGEGRLFNITLMDETGEIRATGFNAAVDELYDKFQEGKVYYVSKARIQIAKKKFSNVQNDYELSLERNTEVEECLETTNVPAMKYNFTGLSDLEKITADATCDVIAIVKEVGPLGEVTSKQSNRTIVKRELTLVDKSGYSVRMTLWGKQAESFTADDFPVVAFKGVKVGDFGGRSLSMLSSSMMMLNPDIEDAYALRGWYDAIGVEQAFQSHSNSLSTASVATFNRSEVRNLGEVKSSQLGSSEKPEYFSARATVMHIKENIAYPSCSTPDCNKKVTQVHDGWRCEKCNRTIEQPQYRYILSMAVADWSGQAWVQGFNDAGVVVFGKSADELMEIKERNEAEYNMILAKVTGTTFNIACRAKQDIFNEQARIRYGLTKIFPVDYREEAQHLTELIDSPWAQGNAV